MLNIHVDSHFKRNYNKLPQQVKELAKEKEGMFRDDPFDPRLKTHKLHGKEHEVYAFWISYKYRIKFIFLSNEEVIFIDIGTHKIYR